jgi:recombination protein RecT
MNNVKCLKDFNALMANPNTQAHLANVLGEKKGAFVNNVTALVANSANLQKCEPMSVMYAGIKATALDLPLDPSLGFAYVIPYGSTAQFQIGYRGLLQLAIRSGQFSVINCGDVREGELIDEDFITGEIKFKRAEARETKPVVGYFAHFGLLNGFKKTLYMTKGQVEEHGKKFSKTYGSGVWKDNFDAMAKKTVLKSLLKYAPLSVELQQAMVIDQKVYSNENGEYLDNVVDVVDEAGVVEKFEGILNVE